MRVDKPTRPGSVSIFANYSEANGYTRAAMKRCGKQCKVATFQQNHKRYDFGAVNMISGSLTRPEEERKTSVGFCT